MRLRKPDWFKVPLSNTTAFQVHRTLRDLYLHTVCREAGCPNIGECFNQGTATFLILGEVCTRNCRFCAIDSGKSPADPDPEEPMRIAEAVRKMKLQHCVITGVNRDDLPDGGAEHYAETIRQVRNLNPNVTIEALTGDFNGLETSLITVLNSSPDV
ncbi:MAG: lipoyl synthase, partial [FCB group bacterium]|nr:lipoyl synthase [FCB group bacterium]